jgi:octaprenyl-diphosphate synthase
LPISCADYGQALGTAFQVIDDVLDYAGAAQEMGKNLGDDLREGKVTLPLIAAMRRGTAEQRDLIRRAVETGDLAELEHVVAIVRSTGALDVAHEAAAGEAQRAMSAAQQLPSNAHAQALVQLAASLLARRN